MPDPLARLKNALADRYTIEHELGSGGMATVYLGRDLKHDRNVGVKVLRPERIREAIATPGSDILCPQCDQPDVRVSQPPAGLDRYRVGVALRVSMVRIPPSPFNVSCSGGGALTRPNDASVAAVTDAESDVDRQFTGRTPWVG